MANPQCLNRYTYSLNNPLRYIDPSGHVVVIMGWDVRDFYNGNFNLSTDLVSIAQVVTSQEFQAYNDIRSVDNTFTNMFEEDNNITVRISNATLQYDPTSYTGATTSRSGDIIDVKIQNDPRANMTTNDSTKFLAHEFVHVYGDILDPSIGNSLFEENLGDAYSEYVCSSLIIKYTDPIANPYSSTDLNKKWPQSTLPTFPTSDSFLTQLGDTFDIYYYFMHNFDLGYIQYFV